MVGEDSTPVVGEDSTPVVGEESTPVVGEDGAGSVEEVDGDGEEVSVDVEGISDNDDVLETRQEELDAEAQRGRPIENLPVEDWMFPSETACPPGAMCCKRNILRNEPDFKEQKCWLQEVVEHRRQRLIRSGGCDPS